MKILALTKYDTLAASTRQRFLQYMPALAAAGMTVELAPLLNNDHIRRLVAARKASPVAVLKAYSKRLATLLGARNFDVLWVHCELFPYLPGFFERLSGIHDVPVVYDYDDAIFHQYDNSRNPVVRLLLANKLRPLLRGARACCCGNAYLYDYAKDFCANSIILPTVVDTARYLPVARDKGERRPIVIGWIGSPSTWPMVRPLLPLLKELCASKAVRIMAVGAGAGARSDSFDGLDLVTWSEDSEIAAVQSMDIGIMPVPDAPFERGKSGYKLIQYMACGLPVVASPVGVNREIVREGENGFLADGEGQWRAALTALIDDPTLRERMGSAGRTIAEKDYSLASQAPRLIELFRSIAPTPAIAAA
jgi:glycosyltransferase involved in cell wall biosynthesis